MTATRPGLLVIFILFLLLQRNAAIAQADVPPLQSDLYPRCTQPPLNPPLTGLDETEYDHQLYLPLIFKAPDPPPPPPCTVYCGLALVDDPYRPAGYQTYFADEFDCDQLLDYWVVQPQMTPASYSPPVTGLVAVSDGALKVAVPGRDVSFPYLYLVDDLATTYDVAHTGASGDWAPRVDWLPDEGNFRIALRVRFNVEQLGEHRISIYADGHRPGYAGPLFYVGADYNDQQEAWRGLIVGADRGNSFVDLGDLGYTDPFTGWVVVTVDFDYSADLFTLAVDGQPLIRQPLSSFKGYPTAATRPDILYLGSLALLQEPVAWSDLELDWLRVYAPPTTPAASFGLLAATFEASPVSIEPHTSYSATLPVGPFQNGPHWQEDFDQPGSDQIPPDNWQLIQNPDPAHAWTELVDGVAALRNNGQAIGVPVWAIFDDMLPITILSEETDSASGTAPRMKIYDPHPNPRLRADSGEGLGEGVFSEQAENGQSPPDYLRQRGGSPFWPGTADLAAAGHYPRLDWRPNEGNVRYAWRGRQTANGYGVEISNGGHFPYFTGAMFYTLQDTTTPGGGQFILPGCQEQYFWRLHRLPGYRVPHNDWTTVTVDYINGTVHAYVDGQPIGWWPESDCSLNWYLKGENATSPDVFFFGNPALASHAPGSWSEVFFDWVATFAGLPRTPPL